MFMIEIDLIDNNSSTHSLTLETKFALYLNNENYSLRAREVFILHLPEARVDNHPTVSADQGDDACDNSQDEGIHTEVTVGQRQRIDDVGQK